MPRERKWVYWHRVTESFDDRYPHGSLIGFNNKEVEIAGVVEKGDGDNFHLDLKILANVKFLDRMLRTATPEEVHNKFKGVA